MGLNPSHSPVFFLGGGGFVRNPTWLVVIHKKMQQKTWRSSRGKKHLAISGYKPVKSTKSFNESFKYISGYLPGTFSSFLAPP